MKRWEIHIPDWKPTSLNQLLKAGPFGAHRIKKRDAEYLWGYGLQAGVPRATGKRRVSLRITLGPRDKKLDRDNGWKALLDGLTAAGYLVNDSEDFVILGEVEYDPAKGRLGTVITLEDVEDS